MTEPRPEKPWWRKRRWRLVIAAWLLLPFLYFASGGPAMYMIERGWLSPEAAATFYRPVHPVFRRYPALAPPVHRHHAWWRSLAARHESRARASD